MDKILKFEDLIKKTVDDVEQFFDELGKESEKVQRLKISSYLEKREIIGKDIKVEKVSIIDSKLGKRVEVKFYREATEEACYAKGTRKFSYAELMECIKAAEREYMSAYNKATALSLEFVVGLFSRKFDSSTELANDIKAYLSKTECLKFNWVGDYYDNDKLRELEELISFTEELKAKYLNGSKEAANNTIKIDVKELIEKDCVDADDLNKLGAVRRFLTKNVGDLSRDFARLDNEGKIKASYYMVLLQKVDDYNFKVIRKSCEGEMAERSFEEKSNIPVEKVLQGGVLNNLEYAELITMDVDYSEAPAKAFLDSNLRSDLLRRISALKEVKSQNLGAEAILDATISKHLVWDKVLKALSGIFFPFEDQSYDRIEKLANEEIEKQFDNISEFMGNINNKEYIVDFSFDETVLTALETAIRVLNDEEYCSEKFNSSEKINKKNESLERITHTYLKIRECVGLLKIAEGFKKFTLRNTGAGLYDYELVVDAYIKEQALENNQAMESVMVKLLKSYIQRQVKLFEDSYLEGTLENISDCVVEVPKTYFKSNK